MSSVTTSLDAGQLYREHGPRLVPLLSRLLRNDADAEDALQDVFLRVGQLQDRIAEIQNLPAFLHRIALNCAFMQLRQAWRHRTVSNARSRAADSGDSQAQRDQTWAEQADSASPSAEEDLIREQVRELSLPVLAEIGNLPKKQRLALRLLLAHDFSIPEVAEKMFGVADKTTSNRVNQLKHQGLTRLRQTETYATVARRLQLVPCPTGKEHLHAANMPQG